MLALASAFEQNAIIKLASFDGNQCGMTGEASKMCITHQCFKNSLAAGDPHVGDLRAQAQNQAAFGHDSATEWSSGTHAGLFYAVQRCDVSAIQGLLAGLDRFEADRLLTSNAQAVRIPLAQDLCDSITHMMVRLVSCP